MHRKLQCLQLALVMKMCPLLDNAQPHIIQLVLQKLNEFVFEILPHLPYSTDLSPADYHFFRHLDNFLLGKHFHNQQEAENAFQEFSESRSTDFYATANLFLSGKNVLIVTVLILINEGNGTPLQYSCLENPMDGGAWKAAVHGIAEGQTRLRDFTFTFYFHALEKEMATHSIVLAWRITGTGEPGRLPSMGSHRVGHD